MRILVVRLGAIGDTFITTPLVRYLYEQGHQIYYLAAEAGQHILENNPRIAKIIPHKRDSVPNDLLGDYFKSVAQAYDCDRIIDLCESVEVRLALHPSDPRYKYPKHEKIAQCNRNYYEEAYVIAQNQCPEFFKPTVDQALKFYNSDHYNPEFFPTQDEDREIRKFMAQYNDRFVVIWGLSGSARQKTYPFVYETVKAINALHNDVVFITVGDEPCQILENCFRVEGTENVVRMCGIWNMRQSTLACKYASLVIAPDTGLLHASGCWETPKIGLLTATTIKNITQYFQNDFSIEAEGVGCAPCMSLIYSANNQCTLGDNNMPVCMAKGLPVHRIVRQFNYIKEAFPAAKVLEIKS